MTDPMTDPMRGRLARALCQTGHHPLSPLTGDAIPCGFHLIRADAILAALGPDVFLVDVETMARALPFVFDIDDPRIKADQLMDQLMALLGDRE